MGMTMNISEERLNCIRNKTTDYTREDLRKGLIVSPDYYEKHDGQHPDSLRDLNTPTSYVSEMLAVWTLDLGYSPEDEGEIERIVTKTICSCLPDELKNYL